MKIGVIYPQTERQGDPEAVRRIRLATEELGYDHLLVYDHVLGATHDRAALNPRPRRVIPIWLSGFVDAALRRAALIGDGFIFADGAVDALEQLQRLRQLLKEAGRSDAGFGLHCNMIRAKTPERSSRHSPAGAIAAELMRDPRRRSTMRSRWRRSRSRGRAPD